MASLFAYRARGYLHHSQKIWVEVPEKCPALGWTKEAKCQNGVFEYKSGYWHDGLVRNGSRHYAHPEGFSLNGSVGHR